MITHGYEHLGEFGDIAQEWLLARWHDWYKYPGNKQLLRRLLNPVRLYRWYRWRQRAETHAQTLAEPKARYFPTEHARMMWKQQQAYQRWLWRNNNALARKLSKQEHWEWD